MELVFSSHKSRPHGGPNSILFLSLHSFSKSQSKRRSQRREAAQPWSVGAQAVGLSLLLCFHSFKPVTAGVFRALLLTQQTSQGYFQPLPLSSPPSFIHSQLLSGPAG